MATAEFFTTKRTRTDRTDWALPSGAMLGAATGALAGVALAGELFVENYAAVLLGTAGTILGSVTCALIGACVICPACAFLRRGLADKND